MWRWVLVMMLVGRVVAEAGTCTTDPDGSVCLLVDGQTTGICKGGACTRTFTVPAGEARTGTGTISSSSGAVTGSGTVFTSELQVGDVLISGSQGVAVRAIISDTSLLTDPAFGPALSGASFTFSNPITKWLDANGVALGLVDARGLVAFGQSYANGALVIIGPMETGAGVGGEPGNIQAGNGGPASVSLSAGSGGRQSLRSGQGGASNFSGQQGGTGGLLNLAPGAGGDNTSGSGQGGLGGMAAYRGGTGGVATGISGTGGDGGAVYVSGGNGGGGHTIGATGDTFLCDLGGLLKVGTAAQSQIDCSTGGFTKIRGVTVSAFPPTNAAGFLRDDVSGNFSYSAASGTGGCTNQFPRTLNDNAAPTCASVAGTDFATQTANTHFAGPASGSAAAPTFRAVVMADLPAAAQNAINAFVHANAGGI